MSRRSIATVLTAAVVSIFLLVLPLLLGGGAGSFLALVIWLFAIPVIIAAWLMAARRSRRF